MIDGIHQGDVEVYRLQDVHQALKDKNN